MYTCHICSKHIINKSNKLCCTVCNKHFHFYCISGITKSDIQYLSKNYICILCNQCNFPFNHFVEENAFKDAIFEYNTLYNRQVSLNNLNEMLFNPFNLN